jgi:hypothetical protein
MPLSQARNFGFCLCSGEFESRDAEIHMHMGTDAEFHLDGVPTGRCDRCGSRVYKASLLGRLEAVYSEAIGASAPELRD